MSRHKIIKKLDLDEELDDYDGGGEDEDEETGYGYGYGHGQGGAEDGGAGGGIEELSEEDRQHMTAGTAAVREILGPDVPDLTDGDIQEALWHYYYDVGQTVTYILDARAKKAGGVKKEKKKMKKGGLALSFSDLHVEGELGFSWGLWPRNYRQRELGGIRSRGIASTSTCKDDSIPHGFWNDMQWLHTPPEQQTVFLEPPHPRGGLLGGSPDAGPKLSKLQALAAARKKKVQEKNNTGGMGGIEKPSDELKIGQTPASPLRETPSEAIGSAARNGPRTYPLRKRKNSSPHGKTPQPADPVEQTSLQPANDNMAAPPIEQAKPSAFANTVFGISEPNPIHSKLTALFAFPYSANLSKHSTDAFAGPSPDDVVLAAQSKAALSKSAKSPSKTMAEKKADQISNGVELMKIDDTPRATSKNLDVLAEYEKTKPKNSANFVVIGHVDAGKSTLMGRLLYDLKMVDKRTIDKYRKEAEKMGKSSFALAWVLDQGTEERSRGVTIDFATNKFETAKTAFTILDAPGHRDFIPNMIAGASQADFAVLVIDASTGSFESGLRGQTKEHALLVRSMGVQRIIIAINKLDTVFWSEDRFVEIAQQVSAFLTAAGFLPKNITFIPVSGLHGDNIVSQSSDAAASWYKGRTLVEELDNSEPISRALDKPLRMTIGDIFRGGVQNPLSISGRIEAGSLQAGDALVAAPSSQKCFVKSLEIDGESVDWAVAGQNVTIHLIGIDPNHLKTGDVLCRAGNEIQSIKELQVKVLAFDFLMPMAVDVHRGRLHAAGKIRQVTAVLDKGTGAVVKKKPKMVKPGSIARLVVDLDHACPLETGQRVVLRSDGATVGAGLLE